MELKVWVEGIQRIVCGVTETTTCQDVVFALAHATGKTGRFTLIERWRNNERLLAPNENPLKILMKWGEYSSDVQFILQRSDQQKVVAPQSADQAVKNPAVSPPQANGSPKKAKPTLDQSKDLGKLLSPNSERRILQHIPGNVAEAADEARKSEIIGIIKGIPHTTMQNLTKISPPLSPCSSTTGTSITTTSDFGDMEYATRSTPHAHKMPELQFNTADIRNALDRKTSFREVGHESDENLPPSSYRSTSSSLSDNTNLDSTTEAYKNGPSISSNGALVPPPYRNPPNPKTNSPLLHTNLFISHQKSDSQSSNTTNSSNCMTSKFMRDQSSPSSLAHSVSPPHPQPTTNIHINALNNLQNIVNNATSEIDLLNDNQFQSAQYRELLQLIHYQRDKINNQQVDISKFDAEINYLEGREQDQIQQMEAITREINRTDQMYCQGNEQLQTLQYVEEENQLVRQQEKTLKSEITLLRSKLANCETELLQCKNKIRQLIDDIQIEQCTAKYDGQRHKFEMNLLHEVERIQGEIDVVAHSTETTNQISDSLKNEVTVIESAIADKKKQLEKLVNEMKEVNLQSLTVTSSEEIRTLFEGSHRPSSQRRIIGSPRQLSTAVPTSKNPHGVWV